AASANHYGIIVVIVVVSAGGRACELFLPALLLLLLEAQRVLVEMDDQIPDDGLVQLESALKLCDEVWRRRETQQNVVAFREPLHFIGHFPSAPDLRAHDLATDPCHQVLGVL